MVNEMDDGRGGSDVRALDGTATIMQPTIEPLFGGRSCHELLSLLSLAGYRSGYGLVRETWTRYWEQAGYTGPFEDFWEASLHNGVVADSAFSLETPALQLEWLADGPLSGDEPPAGFATVDESVVEVVFRPGLVLCGLTLTFASIDWLMSLQPHWYSTIFSMVFAGGLVLTAMAFAVLLLRLLADQPPLSEMVTVKVRNDLGNMLLTLVMFWAYISFSQFLLIWMVNLPEEISWYEPRVAGGWKWVTVFLAVFHFAVPFALLLSRDVKRNLRSLAWVACLVLVMRLVAFF